jgi:hypothetical protein
MDWAELHSSGDYQGIALAPIERCEEFDFDALRDDPFGTIRDRGVIDLVIEEELAESCSGGGGYYDRKTATIYLHPVFARRNNFTLLHEVGHHIQRKDGEWALHQMSLGHFDLFRKCDERVSDAIAACVLLPLHLMRDPLVVSPAQAMAGLFSSTAGSRSAVLKRVASVIGNDANWVLAVADLDGRVVSASTTFERFQPKAGMIQPGFAALAEEARRGWVRRVFREGMVYQGGCELHGMTAEAALDASGSYVFVALTPTHRFGRGEVEVAFYSCENDGCATEDYCADTNSQWCAACGT